MSHRRFKMFSPERISILMLIAAICAWAAVTTCRRIPGEIVDVSIDIPTTDTLSGPQSDSIIILSKKESSNRRNSLHQKDTKKRKAKKEVNHRDHLNEPVAPF